MPSSTTVTEPPATVDHVPYLHLERDALRLEALGLMTAGIVHDLGNVIQILSSAMSILERHPQIKTTKTLQPVIAGAVASLERAGALIKQILGFARDKDAVEQDVDLAMCLADLERLLRWIIKDGMGLDIRVATDVPSLACNRRNLENAVLNLVLNAQDAMPDGGAIVIAAETRWAGGTAAGIVLGVSDNGRGMAPDTLARAFEPFFTTKVDGRGSGLGLAMVRRFAHETGGSVEIESELGAGTQVTLQLPAGRDDAQRSFEAS